MSDLKLPVHVTAIVPACENSVDALSFLPSDVIQSYAGHSIEIIDTDAEGRLILADGLSYLIKNYKPDTVVDLATLTGSVVGTLGYECRIVYHNDELSKNLQTLEMQLGNVYGNYLFGMFIRQISKVKLQMSKTTRENLLQVQFPLQNF